MNLSTKLRYGSRAMVELAAVYPGRVVSVKELALSQRLSPKYLEHIMRMLKAAGLVISVRGIHGGYQLVRPPKDVSLGEVYQVLEGSLAPVDCVEHPETCSLECTCPTRETWIEMKEALSRILESTTLQSLANRMQRKSRAAVAMYHI